jgi:hypothetical protein
MARRTPSGGHPAPIVSPDRRASLERAFYLVPIRMIRRVQSRQALIAACNRWRQLLAPESHERETWAHYAPPALRELSAAMGRIAMQEKIGGNIPQPPAESDSKEADQVSERYIQNVLRAVNEVANWCEGEPPPDDSTPALAEAEQYVTLNQMAALDHRSKKTLERKANATRSDMPAPDVEGGGGKPHEWKWTTIRPWLENHFKRKLPERFPRLNPSANGH